MLGCHFVSQSFVLHRRMTKPLPHFKIIHRLKTLFLMYKTKNKSFEMMGGGEV